MSHARLRVSVSAIGNLSPFLKLASRTDLPIFYIRDGFPVSIYKGVHQERKTFKNLHEFFKHLLGLDRSDIILFRELLYINIIIQKEMEVYR